ncbi:MAG: hypothetical protein QOG67_2543 [Verrucomicrobiota bacterium]|jgi:hypothetical protein
MSDQPNHKAPPKRGEVKARFNQTLPNGQGKSHTERGTKNKGRGLVTPGARLPELLPDPVDMDILIAKFDPCDAPDEVVAGFLHQRSKGALVGGSKTNKTWSLIDLAISVATGTPWWGLETTPGKVLYINFELDDFHFTNRAILVRNAKGVSKLNGNFDYFGFRGKARDWTKLMLQLEEKLKGGGYTLVIIDPLYKGLGNRSENDAGDMTDLHNEIEGLAVASGAAVVYGHHFAKGAQGKKNVEDRGSGSGVFARDPDSILTITRLSEVDGYVVETVLRNFQQLPSFGLRWEWPLMVPDDSMDISKIHEPGKAQSCSKDNILDALREQGELHHEEWYAAVCESIMPRTLSMSTFKRRVGELKACGDVGQVPGTKRTDPWKVT